MFESVLPASVDEVWRFHDSAQALSALVPSGVSIEFLTESLKVENGAIHDFRLRRFGLPLRWTAQICDVEPPYRFTDVAIRCPFPVWRHCHEFLPQGEECLLRDTVEYRPMLFLPGWLTDGLIRRMFVQRHAATRAALLNKKAPPLQGPAGLERERP